MTTSQKQEYLEFAKQMARMAGDIMREYYRSDYKVEEKSDASPVTIADKKINSILIENVKKSFPDHGVLGEEEVWQADKTKLWVCDPIDSTVSFIVHVPTFTFALAYVEDGESLVAVVYNPMTDEMYSAVKGSGAYLNDNPIHVSDRIWGNETRLLRKASPLQINVLDRGEVASELHAEGIRLIANHGAVWSGALIADGSVDGYIYEGTGPHDVASIKLIVEEAGGEVTNLINAEQSYGSEIDGAIISNGKIHQKLIDLVGKYANTRN